MNLPAIKTWTLPIFGTLAVVWSYQYFNVSEEPDDKPAHGVVSNVEEGKSSLTVLVPKKHDEETFTWNNTTVFRKDHGPVENSAVHPGDRVTVEYAKSGKKLIATKVVIHEPHSKHHKA